MSSSALPAPLDTLPKILLFATSSNLSKVTALSSILADASVPDEILSAFKLVKDAPEPLNVPAVNTFVAGT